MAELVRAGLVQAQWAGDKDTMTKNAITSVRQAAAKGAKVVCLQELFNGPYFCQVQDGEWYDFAEPVPDGPTIRQFMDLARELGVVLVVPLYEVEQAGVFYNAAAVIDADGRYLGKHRKNHIPQVAGFWEKFYFRPGNLGYQVFDTAVGRIGVYICYERHFPEGWRALGLAGRENRLQPIGHKPWALGVPVEIKNSPPLRWRTSTSWARSIASAWSPSARTSSTDSRTSWTLAVSS